MAARSWPVLRSTVPFGVPNDALGAFAVRWVGKPNEAAKLYKQVLELEPDHAEASNNLGCLLLAQGKHAAASAYFERALMLLPQLFDDFDSVAAMLLAVNPALGEGVKRAAGPSQRGRGVRRK